MIGRNRKDEICALGDEFLVAKTMTWDAPGKEGPLDGRELGSRIEDVLKSKESWGTLKKPKKTVRQSFFKPSLTFK